MRRWPPHLADSLMRTKRTRASWLQGSMSQTEEQNRWEPKVTYTFVQLATLINSTDGNYTSRELLCLLDPITFLNVPQDEHHCLNIHLTTQRQKAPERGSNQTLYFQIHSFWKTSQGLQVWHLLPSVEEQRYLMKPSANWPAFRLKEDWLPKIMYSTRVT